MAAQKTKDERQKTKDGTGQSEIHHAVITGGTQGIGKAIARTFLDEGFAVHVCARTQADILSLEQEWRMAYGEGRAFLYPTDVSDKQQLETFARLVLKATANRIDVLVNNAGIFLQGDIATEPEGQLRQMLDTNLMSAYHLTRALLPRMIAAGTGHIFNMCSIASLKAYPGGGAYSISKYALLGFSDNLRHELKPYGLRVTAVCLGATWSSSWSGSGVPKERIMEAEDIAKMVWATYSLNAQANVEMIVMRPQQGDL